MATPTPEVEQLFPGDSEMARRMRALDWSATELGPVEDWPENLRGAVRLCLTSRFPALVDEAMRWPPYDDAVDHRVGIRDLDRGRSENLVELTLVKDELAADLKSMIRLHELSTRLHATTELQPLLEEILDAAIELLGADFGNIQLYNSESRTLQIVAHRGFDQEFLDYFANVKEESVACGRAIRQGARVIIDDVETDPDFAPHREIAAKAGFRAVQSTPLFSRSGDRLGIISTHFRAPHHPSDHDLRFIDLYARLATEFIERRRSSEALSASENRFRRYFDLGLIGMAITSPTKGILEVNDELCRILGYEREELLKKSWEEMTHPEDLADEVKLYHKVPEYVHPDDRVRVQTTFDDAVREQKKYELDYRVVWPDGTIRYVKNLAHPVFDDAGNLMEYMGTTIDTTERKQAEEALHIAQAELAHASRLTTLGELTASIAHEVNQPLGAIVTNGHACLRLLSRNQPDVESAREAVESIIADGIRASEVITRIRALLKKSSAGKSSHNINNIIREVITFTAGEREKNEISVSTDLEPDLPLVLADRVQLQQLVLNLVLNSIEAMSLPGWPRRDLLIKTEQASENEIVVTIKDTGVGVDPQKLDQVFEPFFTTKEGGLGLGLSISRTIIEAQGGRLWTTPNSHDQGSSFYFSVPIGPN